MNEHLFVITGSSRGMGEAIAGQLLAPGHFVIGIARKTSAALTDAAQAMPGATLEQWEQDLALTVEAAQRLMDWLERQPARRFGSATLINNAGIVARPAPVDAIELAELSQTLRVGLEATLLMSSAFLRGTLHLGKSRRILNISSGLGRRAMAGSAAYCAAKAGMDNLSRAMALDEAVKDQGAAIVSLAPGVIDTDMQAQLRAGNPAEFPDRSVFVNYKETGALLSPDQAAAKVLRYLARPDFGETVLADVRDA